MNVAEALQSRGLSLRKSYTLNTQLVRKKDEETLNMKMNV